MTQELERLCRDELLRDFARQDGPPAQVEPGGRGTRRKLELREIDPENRRAIGGLEKVAPGAGIGHRPPDRRGDVRLVRVGEAKRNRDRADQRKGGRNRKPWILLLRRRAQTPAHADEAVGGADRPGLEAETVDAFPIGVDRQLLVERRRVGHHRVSAVVVDDELAGDIFEDRAVARGVGEREVAAGLLSTGKIRRDNGERVLAERIDRFRHCAEIVERVLSPGADRDQRLPRSLGVSVVAFDQVERIGDQASVVHSVDGGDIIERRDHRAIFRCPFDGAGARAAVALEAFRE